ncbi:MAG TPA: acyltransferase [Baekduia sp.]|uniref:acyltransferase family protein n=1 Tax=Baekduia sp. TaxID=2600305 RepID=UPI002CDEBA5A|nr:acyltransferase [Baekduia sp.]HMJ33602.1 acyltransferase [Baekduia sp.]
MPTADPPTRPSETPRPRFDALDGLRGLAALGVLVLHVWMFSYGDLHKPPKEFLDFLIGELRLGVQLFFVLSGFLIYRPFVAAALDGNAGPRLRRYVIRRAARILPAYWAALAGSFLLLRHLDHPMQIDVAQLPVFLLFAENQFDETIKHLDPPMWTLAIEVSFYAVLPLIGALALRLGAHRGRQAALTLAVVAGGALSIVLAVQHHWPKTLSTSLLPHLVEFGAGMTAAVLLHRRSLTRRVATTTLLAGAALIIINSVWHAKGLGSQSARNLVGDAPGIAGIALVLAALVASPIRATALSRGPARWLGKVSYGVYLVHFPVIVFLRETHRWPDTLTRQLLMVMAITLPVATLSWLLLERPAVRWAQRVTRGRAPRPAPAGAPAAEPRRQQTGERRALRPQPAES